MNIEERRLRTFREWPANAAVDPVRLAKAGFYYSGHVQEVQCFLCGAKISDWNYGDQAMGRHRQKSPSCPFVLSPSSTCNVPLVPATVGSAAAESTARRQSSDSRQSVSVQCDGASAPPLRPLDFAKEYVTFAKRLQSFKNWPITNIVHPEKLAMAGFYYLQKEDMVECAFCRGILMNWKPGDTPDCAHRFSFPNCDFYLRQDVGDDLFGVVRVMPETMKTNLTKLGIESHKAPQRPEYATYERRLQTFRDWPEDLIQTPEMLAEAGFYYGGYADQVRCFHCDGGLRNWQPTDDVWMEHAKWFANCGFMNLIFGQEFLKVCIKTREPLDLSSFTSLPEENNTTESSTEPLSSTSQPNESDVVTSSAAVEKALSVPLVAQSKEPDTSVIDVETPVLSSPAVPQSSKPDTAVGATEATVASLPTVLCTVKPSVQPSVSITNAAVEELLETAPAKAALEIGLHVGRVKRALKKRMESVGKPYTDVVQLIQDVLYDQVMEEDNRLDDTTSNSPTAELNTLFDQVTMQMTNNSAKESSTREPDAIERDPEKRKTDNESDDLISLREENRKLKEARLCKVCMDHELAVVFLPCGHLGTCNYCAPALSNCPLCRLRIRAYVRVFLS
ncbi:PREDICTED: E3 ubiquitin-protein ligase XIAP-like [Vollenhovia emeryi]|uniref:E3 ubiquitin-protein ligase XIAP-like n=1 Tax=Vollenhovia emeryi TaxID=411798 RepID=UPI0005F4F5C8|nr:PREDICTED: E3 ubiquitin-protein ligase XIAP-like [Vollenhovia emeryi]